jgi:hypothetical protein
MVSAGFGWGKAYNGSSMATRLGIIPGRYGRVATLLMLTPMMLLNAAQTMTLCVGHDGHVAVELLVQDHCVCNTPTSESHDLFVDATLNITDGRDLSCTDLAIPTGVCSVRPAPAPSKAVFMSLTTTPPLLSPALTDTSRTNSRESSLASGCYYAPLNSIILRV